MEVTHGFDRAPIIHYSKWEAGLMFGGWNCSCGNERRSLTSSEMQSRHTALWMEVQSRIIIRNTTRLFNIPGIHLPQLSSLRNRQQEGRGTNPRGMWREQEGACSGESQVGDHAQGVEVMEHALCSRASERVNVRDLEIWKLRSYTECQGNPQPPILES